MIKVWQTRILEDVPDNIEPGRIIAVEGDQITVKAGEGAIVLIEHEFDLPQEIGDYL